MEDAKLNKLESVVSDEMRKRRETGTKSVALRAAESTLWCSSSVEERH